MDTHECSCPWLVGQPGSGLGSNAKPDGLAVPGRDRSSTGAATSTPGQRSRAGEASTGLGCGWREQAPCSWPKKPEPKKGNCEPRTCTCSAPSEPDMCAHLPNQPSRATWLLPLCAMSFGTFHSRGYPPIPVSTCPCVHPSACLPAPVSLVRVSHHFLSLWVPPASGRFGEVPPVYTQVSTHMRTHTCTHTCIAHTRTRDLGETSKV